ncbi:MAG TPA: malto-oligosyltrehalose synthase [Gemmatimonadaceae bacterium]|nr:malto-oligosyltrehalose synthase [Gemmatimonadaceae bacterium]
MARLSATYRLQLHAGFTFAHVAARVDYFARLGVTHLYLSPIVMSRRGSRHGYDVVDPARIDPALGTEDDLRRLARELSARDMGLIVDIVPNHMGIGPDNPYWDDVLARGERSRYAHWFDIDWTPRNGTRRRVVLPVLGDRIEQVLERGELAVRVIDGRTPRLVYGSLNFPIEAESLPPELQLAAFDPDSSAELSALCSGSAGADRLRALLDAQHYCLVDWRTQARDLNYRRFFDVNDLAALRMEDERVFRETHGLVLRLVCDRVVDGLRVDHIDGLLEPHRYLDRLRAAVPPGTPIVVEKILSGAETLRHSWPVDGTTGYDFLNELEDLFIDPSGYTSIERSYCRMRRLGDTSFRRIAIDSKLATLAGPLAPDIDRLVELLQPLAEQAGCSCSLDELRTGIMSFVAALPVYRTYVKCQGDGLVVADADRAAVRQALDVVCRFELPAADAAAFVGAIVAGDCPTVDARDAARFVLRLQQLSGPATAKGIEDTALYAYNPLASRNEVGGAPDRPLDDAVPRFHAANAQRAARWPRGLICTNTHDTKRSADVRARLDAFTEVPHDWERTLKRWRRLNAKHRRVVRGRLAPDTNTEYLLYQTIVALWPPPRAGRRADDLPDRAWRDAARDRLVAYARKAAREAKTRTNWVDPDLAYESALEQFVSALLEPNGDAPFLVDVSRFVARIARTSAFTSLARIAIHLTAPGTPDIYQGDELWNFTLVDPDNRRDVDYDARATAMAEIDALRDKLSRGDPVDPFDGRLKLLVTRELLELRRREPASFIDGGYTPLAGHGLRAGHVVAFARRAGEHCVVTIASRLVDALPEANMCGWWGDTTVELPPTCVGRAWRSQIGRFDVEVEQGAVKLGSLLRALPLAVLAT